MSGTSASRKRKQPPYRVRIIIEFSACNRHFTTRPTLFFCELYRHGGVREGLSHLARETGLLSG